MTKTIRESIETSAVHAGEPRPRVDGSVITPIFQSSTYDYTGQADYHDVRYIRLNNNPNQLVLGAKIAALEGTEAAPVAASGMAAISGALLSVLSSGDHLLAQDCLYGGTHGLVTKDFPSFNIAHTFIDPQAPATWKKALRPNTKAIYAETLTNPLLQLADLKAIARFAKEHGLVTIIDNTFASPVNFQPAVIGFDLIIGSGTKYLNGHNDIVAGAVSGSREWVTKVKHRLDHLGGTLDPHAAFLLNRGIKTLAIRVRYQNESALRIAKFLAQHRAIGKVNYPGLETHPQHARARELLSGFGGMMSFELKGGLDAAERMMKRVQIPSIAPSLGGAETLMVRPAAAVHSNLSPEERKQSGIADGLIRLSVGLEGTDDLIADFEQALT